MPRLDSIAEIRMGATLRGRDATRPVPEGYYSFLRIGDISQDGTFDESSLDRIEPNEPINENLILREGDVLFPNRGTRTTALCFPGTKTLTIVGSQFFILRANRSRFHLNTSLGIFAPRPPTSISRGVEREATYSLFSVKT